MVKNRVVRLQAEGTGCAKTQEQERVWCAGVDAQTSFLRHGVRSQWWQIRLEREVGKNRLPRLELCPESPREAMDGIGTGVSKPWSYLGFRKTSLDPKWRVDRGVRHGSGRAETGLIQGESKQERSFDQAYKEEWTGIEEFRWQNAKDLGIVIREWREMAEV